MLTIVHEGCYLYPKYDCSTAFIKQNITLKSCYKFYFFDHPVYCTGGVGPKGGRLM